MSNSFIWPIDRTLSGATTLGQNGFVSKGNEGALHIFQYSSITAASPSDCLMSYPGHTLGRVLLLCSDAVGLFYSAPPTADGTPSWLLAEEYADCISAEG